MGRMQGTSGTVVSIEVLLPEAYGTDSFCPQVDTGQVGSGILEGAADGHASSHNERASRDDVDNARCRVGAAAIAAHFGVGVKEVEHAIQRQVKSERNQADEQRRGK